MESATSSRERPPATLNGAKWISSDARKLMAQDILDGYIPLEGPVDIEDLYNRLYSDHPLFTDFPFDKKRYADRLKTLRTQVYQFKKWANYNEKALQAGDRLV